ncbi:MAG: SAM-dependent methyltransferase [Bacteroidales bacterium]|jgi:16S rRNA (cytidine1402-2'-O)-methyltransferase|nr:SAM-dependent methyltransferase [Bacteroidales bacterium]
MSKLTNPGKLFLIPTPLGGNDPAEVIPGHVLETACGLHCFVVEELRTARRFLSAYGLRGQIDALDFHVLNEHTAPEEVEALLPLFEGQDVGLMSEAGLPAVADPGAALVALCHRHDIEVVPLVGPSSLLLALMSSGLNGQSFAFRGYIPAKSEERRAALRELEKQSRAMKQSQILIETPYRNDALLSDMLQTLSPATRLCVAADLTLPTQDVATKTVSEWRRCSATVGKRPCVFILLA